MGNLITAKDNLMILEDGLAFFFFHPLDNFTFLKLLSLN